MFFVGDSAGHCLPPTAEGIRTAFYFGIACGRELRAVLEGRRSREQALDRYAAFSAVTRLEFACMLRVQDTIPKLRPRALAALARTFERGGPALGVRALPAHRAAGVRPARAAGGGGGAQRGRAAA